MLTEKENFLRTLRGECPEWVPTYSMFDRVVPGMAERTTCVMLCPEFLTKHRTRGVGGIDIWGVEYVPTYETGGATLPKPGNFILKDIRKWRDVIKAPDVSGFNWEATARKNIEVSGINREKNALNFDLHFGYFQLLISFMGFTEGLCAMVEEPEEVYALIEYLSDFYCGVAEKAIGYYQPDIISIKDDTAAWANPFISLKTYESLLLPFYDRQAKFARDRGLPVTFHNCGHCEMFLEDMHSIGVTLWEPAQTCNDLVGIKKKFGNELVIAGGWDGRGRFLQKDVTDDEIYQSVTDTIKTLGAGGGYCWCGGIFGLPGDEESVRKNKVVNQAYTDIAHKLYN